MQCLAMHPVASSPNLLAGSAILGSRVNEASFLVFCAGTSIHPDVGPSLMHLCSMPPHSGIVS